MSGLTFFMLLVPGSPLDALWRLNPRAQAGLRALGWWALLLMGATSLACATAALGLWRGARWGFWLAIVILTVNLTGDTTNAMITGDFRALLGLPIAGAMIWYLILQRRFFGRVR